MAGHHLEEQIGHASSENEREKRDNRKFKFQISNHQN